MAAGADRRGDGARAAISIAIVGTGIRGLGVLERMVAYARKYPAAGLVRVHLVDPSSHGPEQYDSTGPDYLLLNIVCGQVSMFPDTVSVGEAAPTSGPNLHEWCVQRGLLLGADGFTVGQHGRPIEADDFLPRRLLGEYLEWFRAELYRRAAPCVNIVDHRAKAIDLTTDGDAMTLELSDGTVLGVDYLFLTVGQVPERAEAGDGSPSRVLSPYPLPGELAAIGARQSVAIAGLGLTAVDVVLALTVGRGGSFTTHDGVVDYVASGREPQILAYSRSGLPYRSRPRLGAPIAYEAVVFTRGAIDALRVERGPQLDYDRDVLPLLLTELRVAYWRAHRRREGGSGAAEKLLSDMRAAFTAGSLDAFLSALDAEYGAFDPRRAYFTPLRSGEPGQDALAEASAYQRWYQGWLERDLAQADLGVAVSPLKAALEICREFREVIRYAVDFGGLTDESSDRFFSVHAEALNRIGVGPQRERTAEILALMRAGVLRVPLGPNPTVGWDESRQRWHLRSSLLSHGYQTDVDWMCFGATSRLRSLAADPDIVGAMARRGVLRRLRPDSSVVFAVDIGRSYHPISRAGRANERIWVMGLLCEGATFYNGYVTSPSKFVRSQHDADRAVAQIFVRGGEGRSSGEAPSA